MHSMLHLTIVLGNYDTVYIMSGKCLGISLARCELMSSYGVVNLYQMMDYSLTKSVLSAIGLNKTIRFEYRKSDQSFPWQ